MNQRIRGGSDHRLGNPTRVNHARKFPQALARIQARGRLETCERTQNQPSTTTRHASTRAQRGHSPPRARPRPHRRAPRSRYRTSRCSLSGRAPRSCGRSVPSPISDEANRDLLRTTAPGADCPGTRAGESSSRAIPSPLPPTERPSSPSAARRSSPHGDHSIAFRPTTGCCGCNPRHLPLYLRLQPDIVLPQSLAYPRNAELDFRGVSGPKRTGVSQFHSNFDVFHSSRTHDKRFARRRQIRASEPSVRCSSDWHRPCTKLRASTRFDLVAGGRELRPAGSATGRLPHFEHSPSCCLVRYADDDGRSAAPP
jgi:hypothetical protein